MDTEQSTPLLKLVPVGALLIILSALIVYSNSFDLPFIFDDEPHILENQSITHLNDLSKILTPGGNMGGRVVVNLSLAVNYAISGYDPWSYHLLNMIVHVLAAMTLFGIIRQTLLSETLKSRYGPIANELSLICAILWVIHPLQTQAVTYVIQRCESLMGLFFLLTLYCAIKGFHLQSGKVWHLFAVLSLLAGLFCKEVIIVAPVLVYGYDYFFNHKGPVKSLKQSPFLYVGFLACILAFGFTIYRFNTISQGRQGLPFDSWQYALTQSQVVMHYFKLAFWPDPLCFDYHWPVATLAQVYPYLIGIAALVATSVVLIVFRHPAGFPLIWIFVILAPTSSFMVIKDMAVEHRMYLPLAGLIVLTVFGVYAVIRISVSKIMSGKQDQDKTVKWVGMVIFLTVAIILGRLTIIRNHDYRSNVSIWSDTLLKSPDNPRAFYNLGTTLMETDQLKTAIALLQKAIELKPGYIRAHINLGTALARNGDLYGAIDHFKKAIALKPDFIDTYLSLAQALEDTGQLEQALQNYKIVVEHKPDANSCTLYGMALIKAGKTEQAQIQFEKALKIDPGYELARKQLDKLH